MNKNLFWGLGGLILGIAAGIVIDRKVLAKPVVQNEEVDSLIDEINHLHAQLMDIAEENAKTSKGVSKELSAIKSNQINAHPAMINGDRNNLRRLASKYHDRDLTQHLVERESPSEEDYDVYDQNCPVIEISEETAREIAGNVPGLELEQVYYYPMDDVLTDGNGDMMIETIDVFGAVLQETIRERTEDFIFTVSWPHGLVYEIVLEHGTSYYGDPDPNATVDPDGEDIDSDFDDDDDDFDPRYPNG